MVEAGGVRRIVDVRIADHVERAETEQGAGVVRVDAARRPAADDVVDHFGTFAR
jgi:hypothetical protein